MARCHPQGVATEAVSVADRLPVSPAWRPAALFRLGLGVSLLLHALILLLPVRIAAPRDEAPVTEPLRATIVSPRAQAGRADSPSAALPTRAAAASVPRGQPVRVAPRPLLPERQDDAAAVPEHDTLPAAGLNLDELREQARSLGRNPGEALVRGGSATRKAVPEAVPDLSDRPILQALSRRLGKPLVIAGEQIMADGSRLIRFSGNTCLHVPRHLPMWRENPIGPTVLVPTTCPDE